MFNNILRSKWFTVAAFAALIFIAVSFLKIGPALVAVNKESNSLDKKIADVKKTASDIERLGGYFKSEAYLERQARLKLNYKKPDEKVVYVYPKPDALVKPNSAAEAKKENNFFSNFEAWFNYLWSE